MPLPIVPIALAAGALAILALANRTPQATGVSGQTTTSLTPGAQPMPVELKAKYDDLLANGVNADGLETVAAEMEKFGFTTEGATLRARAAQLRSLTPKTPATPSPASPAPAPQPAAAPPPFVPGVIPNTPAPLPPPAAAPPPFVPGVIPNAPQDAPPPAIAAAVLAKVTTNDPAPDGDLIMRDAPSESGTQVPGGGAEKDGIVQLINANASGDGVWAEINWPGGSRRPAAHGFAKAKFLAPLPPNPTVSGIVVGAVGTRYARCVAPSGCRLRVAPSTTATYRAIVASGDTVQVLQHAQGSRVDVGSPGPGGWAQVLYKGLMGWVPSEWLVAS